jgi:hypothetical protein
MHIYTGNICIYVSEQTDSGTIEMKELTDLTFTGNVTLCFLHVSYPFTGSAATCTIAAALVNAVSFEISDICDYNNR